MWIEIKSELFIEGNVNELRTLIQSACYKRRYELYIDLTNVSTDILNEFYPENIEIVEEYFNNYMTVSPKISHIVNSIGNEDTHTISDAIKYINLPLQIVLENSNNDGYFLDALLREFKKQSKKIQRYKNEQWLKYSNAGGDNFENFIKGEINNLKGKLKFLKLFIIIDSDLEYPHTPNAKKAKLEKLLEEYNIPYHVLEKREIENYMPDSLIREIDPQSEFIMTYLSELSERQKDYIDIEKGFQLNSSTLENNKNEVYKFYTNPLQSKSKNNEKIDKLRNGLSYKFDNFKNEFPKKFENVSQVDFLERTKNQNNPNELVDLLKKITSLL